MPNEQIVNQEHGIQLNFCPVSLETPQVNTEVNLKWFASRGAAPVNTDGAERSGVARGFRPGLRGSRDTSTTGLTPGYFN